MNKIFIYSFLFAVTYYTFAKPVDNQLEPYLNNSCHFCEELIGVVEKDANLFNKTISDIIIVIKDICNDVSGPSGKECIFILNNIQQIMKWVMSGISPHGICSKLGLCNNTIICVDDL